LGQEGVDSMGKEDAGAAQRYRGDNKIKHGTPSKRVRKNDFRTVDIFRFRSVSSPLKMASLASNWECRSFAQELLY